MSTLRTVLGALEVLEYLGAQDGQVVRLTDISRDLHFPKSRVYRILSTLEQEMYVWQDPESRGYSLSLRTWLLGQRTKVYPYLESLVRPYINELAEQSQETSIFAVLDGMKAVHLTVSHTDTPVLAYVREGSRVPLHASATGKAFLARLDPEFIPQMLPPQLERYTPKTIVDREDLQRDIEQVRERKYATGIDEISEGLSGVAAAAVIGKQMIYWAIGISGPTSRITNGRLPELGNLVVKAVSDIQEKLTSKIEM